MATHHPRWRALAVAAALVVASCGGDDDGATATTAGGASSTAPVSAGSTAAPTTAAPADDVDPEGILRWTRNLEGATAGHFDPTKLLVLDQSWALHLVYDSLLRGSADEELQPALAEQARVVDPQTIEVDLRPGLVFSDGTPLDAAAVQATIERNKATQVGTNGFRPEIRNVAQVEVASSTALVIHLDAPVAGAFYPLLGGIETMPVSPEAAADPAIDLDATPVGAGAFTLTSYVSGQRATFAKNPTYWDADSIRLAGVEVISLPAGPAVLNALRSGAIDVAPVNTTDVASLRTDFDVEVKRNPTSHLWFRWCTTAEPIDDVRVRQALSLATDRVALAEAVAGDDGVPMWALWPVDHPLFPTALEGKDAHDPSRARQLLGEAGFPDGLATQVMIGPDPFHVRVAEIIQAQWAEVGVDLEITTSANVVQDFYQDRKAPMSLAAVVRPGIDKLSAFYMPGLFANVCGYESPEMTAIVQRLRAAEPGSAEALEAWADGQELAIDQELSLYLVHMPLAQASDGDRVGDLEMFVHWLSPMPDVWTAYIKA